MNTQTLANTLIENIDAIHSLIVGGSIRSFRELITDITRFEDAVDQFYELVRADPDHVLDELLAGTFDDVMIDTMLFEEAADLIIEDLETARRLQRSINYNF